ncbi:MAG: sulfite exporter TauE/SafE family protein [Candidatus Yanofskybacteria bacterium]|nr:sulfite exporter TauE/SafE family protein [Candidatus Yanofskybacteria bacterium]
MPEFNLAITISAFIAGLLTFFAPCTLPLVPAFLGIISGVGPEILNDPLKLKAVRWKIFKNAVSYVVGFSIIFILFGAAFSYLGTILAVRLWLEKLGGLFVLAFGLFLLGWLEIPFLNTEFRPVRSLARPPRADESRWDLGKATSNGISLLNSFILGALFALGWSPCVGPLLGSILLLATTAGTVFEGIFLLIIFSIGLAIPFLVTSLLVGKAFTVFSRWGKFIGIINKAGGIFLVIIGFLLILGRFELIHSQFKNYFYNFQFFEVFINRYL